jgi:hypothetical protein
LDPSERPSQEKGFAAAFADAGQLYPSLFRLFESDADLKAEFGANTTVLSMLRVSSPSVEASLLSLVLV